MKYTARPITILVTAFAAVALLSGPAAAENKKDCTKEQANAQPAQPNAPIGYGGAKVQMMPFMTPYRDDSGVRYQALMVRLVLDSGPKERSACFSVPYVHDRMLTYLFGANLTADDFVGERRDALAKNLFDVAVDTVGSGYYTGVEIVGPDSAELDCKSATLSSQCK